MIKRLLKPIAPSMLTRPSLDYSIGNDFLRKKLLPLVRATPHPLEAKILEYLNSAEIREIVFTMCEDPFTGEFTADPSSCNDGVWWWDKPTIYFVQRYHIALPEEFIAHAEKNGWVCPKTLPEDVAKLDYTLTDEDIENLDIPPEGLGFGQMRGEDYRKVNPDLFLRYESQKAKGIEMKITPDEYRSYLIWMRDHVCVHAIEYRQFFEDVEDEADSEPHP